MGTRQHRCRNMRACRHDVAAGQNVRHHHGMQGFLIAAVQFVMLPQKLVNRRKKRSGAACKIRHPKPCQIGGIGPILPSWRGAR